MATAHSIAHHPRRDDGLARAHDDGLQNAGITLPDLLIGLAHHSLLVVAQLDAVSYRAVCLGLGRCTTSCIMVVVFTAK